MSLKIRLRPEAKTDIESAAVWYERLRKILGKEFLDEVQSVCNTISEHPKLYPVIHRRTRRAVIQRFPFGTYFRVEEECIVVVAVMHGSRHPKQWQQRR